jgi:ferredoxin-NADP reductase
MLQETCIWNVSKRNKFPKASMLGKKNFTIPGNACILRVFTRSLFMSTKAQHVDPWLLSHGLIFVINYSILMPVATFLIYYNRDRFYQAHCLLGIAITVLLVAGWASLAGAAHDRENGFTYGAMSESSVAKSHSVTGIIARFVAVVVCVVGVALGVLRMPKTVRTTVRGAHGIGGILISLFGPIVVWNGFVRLQPFLPPIMFFDSSPVFWYSVVIGLVSYASWKFIQARNKTIVEKVDEPDTEMTDIETSIPNLTIVDAVNRLRDDKNKLYVFYGDQLIAIPRLKAEFDHPGGIEPMLAYEGKDISGIFTGFEGFDDSGRQRFHAHSLEAKRVLFFFRVGRVCGPLPLNVDSSTVMGGTGMSFDESNAAPMFSIDEEGKATGQLVEIEKMNSSSQFPVVRFTIEVEDFVLLSSVNKGMKVRLGLPDYTGIERTYTVVEFDSSTKRLQLIIKIYPDGELTSKLEKMQIGETVNLSGLSRPPLPFYLTEPPFPHMLLLAGGTGIVPIMYYLEQAVGETTIYWSLRFYEDIFFVTEISDKLRMKSNASLIVFFTGEKEASNELRFACENMEIRLGRIEFQSTENPEEQVAVMSGPREFVTSMHTALITQGLRPDRILSLD